MSLEHALKIAQANTVIGLPKMAALIYDKKTLISVGLNSKRTHPLQAKFNRHEEAICLHAEISALVNARCDVAGMTMYIARAGHKNQPRLAKPCFGCQRALTAFKLKRVIWTLTGENHGSDNQGRLACGST